MKKLRKNSKTIYKVENHISHILHSFTHFTHFTLENNYWAPQNLAASISESYVLMRHWSNNIFYKKKNEITSRKHWAKWTKKRLNMIIYMRRSIKNIFQSKKDFHWKQRIIQNFSRWEKVCSPRQIFSLSLSGQNAASTKLLHVRKTKKTDRKTKITETESKRNQDHRNIAPPSQL